MNAEKSALIDGIIHYQHRSEEVAKKEWAAHPVFPGVRLKHLICGGDTERRCSAHLVRIDPNCSLGEHRHEGQMELHQVLSGGGNCRLRQQDLAYLPGRMTVIPQGAVHSVEAGDEGLTLLASFFPAIV